MRRSHAFVSFISAAALMVLPVQALADQIEGQYSGASSIAGGTGECWGNNPASAVVTGGTVTIRYVAYEGTQSILTADVHPDGTFSLSQPIKNGSISYSGKIRGNRLTAQWKGPVCYGTLDMTR